MTEIIKQRLVGMLIVVIASVVFLPDLLDGQKNSVKEEFKKLPPRPESVETPIIREFPTEKVNVALANAPQVDEQELADDAPAEGLEDNTTQVSKLAKETALPAVNAEPNSSTVTNSNDVTEQAEQRFKDNAWVLRLGTFRNKPNVDALLNKLETAGVKTFVKPVEAKAGTLYRVFVGPELEKSKLEKAQQTLKELTGLDGKITQFQPIN